MKKFIVIPDLRLVLVIVGLSFLVVSTVSATWVCQSNNRPHATPGECAMQCPGSCNEAPDNPFADPRFYPHIAVPVGGGPITEVGPFLSAITGIIELAQIAFWILAVGFGLYSAYLYLFSGGSTEKVAQAQRMLIYTAVASVVAILAYGLPAMVSWFIIGGA